MKRISQLPDPVKRIIDFELIRLAMDANYDLHPRRRLEITEALGSYGESGIDMMVRARIEGSECRLPELTPADRVRARLAILTAQKVMPLWEIACAETDDNFKHRKENSSIESRIDELDLTEEEYRQKRKVKPIWDILIYDVPRAFIPSHIIDMTELALSGPIEDCAAFAYQVNECWEMYGRPENIWREFSIKWAAQEALYSAVNWQGYRSEFDPDIDMDDDIVVANIQHDGPGGHALLAYASVFNEPEYSLDRQKRREFWRWWLAEAIPLAWHTENMK